MDVKINKVKNLYKRTSVIVHLYGVLLVAILIARKWGLNLKIASMTTMLHELYTIVDKYTGNTFILRQ